MSRVLIHQHGNLGSVLIGALKPQLVILDCIQCGRYTDIFVSFPDSWSNHVCPRCLGKDIIWVEHDSILPARGCLIVVDEQEEPRFA